MSTRRSFLKVSTAACAVSALPANLFAQAPSSNPFTNANLAPYAQGILNKSAFDAVLNTVFTVFTPAGTVYMRLIRVEELDGTAFAAASHGAPTRATGRATAVNRATTPTSAGYNFHLSFAVSGPSVAQGTYTIDHASLGRFALFIVPGGTPDAQTAGATFNYDPRAFSGMRPGMSFVDGGPPAAPASRGRSTLRTPAPAQDPIASPPPSSRRVPAMFNPD